MVQTLEEIKGGTYQRSMAPALEEIKDGTNQRSMVQTLEEIKGGGGSVKVGTTGTISALMSRELHAKSSSGPPSSSTSTSTGDRISVELKTQMTANDASSSSNNNSSIKNHKISQSQRKTRHQRGSSNKIPMLKCDNISVDGTPARKPKATRKGSGVVEVVDIRCGHPDKPWVNPLANRLKKFGFSKLSESSCSN